MTVFSRLDFTHFFPSSLARSQAHSLAHALTRCWSHLFLIYTFHSHASFIENFCLASAKLHVSFADWISGSIRYFYVDPCEFYFGSIAFWFCAHETAKCIIDKHFMFVSNLQFGSNPSLPFPDTLPLITQTAVTFQFSITKLQRSLFRK